MPSRAFAASNEVIVSRHEAAVEFVLMPSRAFAASNFQGHRRGGGSTASVLMPSRAFAASNPPDLAPAVERLADYGFNALAGVRCF